MCNNNIAIWQKYHNTNIIIAIDNEVLVTEKHQAELFYFRLTKYKILKCMII